MPEKYEAYDIIKHKMKEEGKHFSFASFNGGVADMLFGGLTESIEKISKGTNYNAILAKTDQNGINVKK